MSLSGKMHVNLVAMVGSLMWRWTEVPKNLVSAARAGSGSAGASSSGASGSSSRGSFFLAPSPMPDARVNNTAQEKSRRLPKTSRGGWKGALNLSGTRGPGRQPSNKKGNNKIFWAPEEQAISEDVAASSSEHQQQHSFQAWDKQALFNLKDSIAKQLQGEPPNSPRHSPRSPGPVDSNELQRHSTDPAEEKRTVRLSTSLNIAEGDVDSDTAKGQFPRVLSIAMSLASTSVPATSPARFCEPKPKSASSEAPSSPLLPTACADIGQEPCYLDLPMVAPPDAGPGCGLRGLLPAPGPIPPGATWQEFSRSVALSHQKVLDGSQSEDAHRLAFGVSPKQLYLPPAGGAGTRDENETFKFFAHDEPARIASCWAEFDRVSGRSISHAQTNNEDPLARASPRYVHPAPVEVDRAEEVEGAQECCTCPLDSCEPFEEAQRILLADGCEHERQAVLEKEAVGEGNGPRRGRLFRHFNRKLYDGSPDEQRDDLLAGQTQSSSAPAPSPSPSVPQPAQAQWALPSALEMKTTTSTTSSSSPPNSKSKSWNKSSSSLSTIIGRQGPPRHSSSSIPEPAGEQKQAKTAPPRQPNERLKKTRLCTFATTGRCPNAGVECPYAHSREELRKQPDLRKTSLCTAFAKGECPYPAEHCWFAHGVEERRIDLSVWKTKPCTFFQNRGYCKWGDKCSHLHVRAEDRVRGSPAGAGAPDGRGRRLHLNTI